MNKKWISSFLCLVLLCTQGSWAYGTSFPSASSDIQVTSLKNVKGPDGKPITAYTIQGASLSLDGYQRVHAFDQKGRIIKGLLVNPKEGLVQWEGQTLQNSPMKPSRVMKRTTWDKERRRSMGSLISRLKKGDKKLVQELHEENARTLETNRASLNGVGNATQVAASFYMAMGVLAVIELSTNYSNNPNAWSDFADSLNDPVGWLMLPSFILASQGVYRLFGATKNWKMAVLRNGLGMSAGIIVSTVLGKMMMDPNFKKCLGFATYDQRYRFERNESACDHLFANWSGEDLFLTIVPVIGHAVLAGTMVSAFEWLLGSSLNAVKIGQKIRMAAGFLRKTPRSSGLVAAVSSMGSMVLFLGAFQISYELVDLETSLREFFLTTYNPFSKSAGADLPRNMDRLAKNFQAELDHHFAKEVSLEGTDLKSALTQHSVLMSKWRALKFKKISDAYGQWQLRNAALYENALVSHEVYASMLDALSKAKRGEVDLNSQAFQDIARSSINKNPELKNVSVDTEDLFDYVRVFDHHDFFITSMACGPNPQEKTDSLSLWQKTKKTVWGDATPQEMIYNEHSDKAVFYPPRLVNPTEENICTKDPVRSIKSGWKVLDTARNLIPDPTAFVAPSLYTPLTFFGEYKDEGFKGLYEYLLKAVPEELAPKEGPSQFEEWWSAHVLPALDKANEEMVNDYHQFLDTTYRQVLSHPVVNCEYRPQLQVLTGAGSLLNQAGIIDECASRENVRMGEGLTFSVLEEIALYDGMILKILENQNADATGIKEKMLKRLSVLRKVLDGLTLGREGLSTAAEFSAPLEEIKSELEEELIQAPVSPRAREILKTLIQTSSVALGEGTVYVNPLLGERVFAP